MLLSDLMGAEVVDEAGNSRGHVHDVRARVLQRRSSEGYQLRVIGLVVGRRGIRERLRMDPSGSHAPVSSGDVVEWDDVLAVDVDKATIKVRGQ